METTAMKRTAAEAALPYIDREAVLGVGSGSTVSHFLELLSESGIPPAGAVAASLSSARALDGAGVTVFPLAEVVDVPVYIDSADAVDPRGRMIKGAGGAHTQEKRIARASDLFICIVDESKMVERLSEYGTVPLEVLGAQLGQVTKALDMRGARVTMREERSESGNLLVDVRGYDLTDPERAELELESIEGVVASGIFATRRADIALVAGADGNVRTIDFRG